MKILVLPWRYGQKKLGVDKGSLLLSSIIHAKNPRLDYKFVFPKKRTNSIYHHQVYNIKKNVRDKCLVLGGDHSIAIGSLLGTLNSGIKNIGVLWIDAHPDINTISSSTSKNCHGMPLSFITGLEDNWSWINPLNKLKLKDLHYWGIRDIDHYENEIIQKTNIIKYTDNVKNMINNYDYIHLSLDIDGIDPIYMPSTGTPVKNGLKLDDVIDVIKYLIKSEKNYTIDIVEYNPEIGSSKDKDITLSNINKIIDIILT